MYKTCAILVLLIVGSISDSTAVGIHGAGVPTPSFGLDSTSTIIESLQQSGAAQHYFVDNQHPSATDRENQFGSHDRPRVTLPTGDLNGGTILTINGGPYEGPTIKWNTIGTSRTPVLIQGQSDEAPPIIRQQISIKGHYAIVEGLLFDRDRRSISIVPGSSHLAIRSNKFVGSGVFSGNTSVLSARGTAQATTSNIVFAENEISGFGDSQPLSRENDYHGIKASRYCSNIWILSNRIFSMAGDSVQIGDATLPDAARCSRVFIANNEFFGNRENAVDIKRANGIVITKNHIHSFLPPVSIDAPTIIVHDGADSVWILANDISNASSGIANTFGTNVWIIGNNISNMVHTPSSKPDELYGNGTGVHFRGQSSGGVLLNAFDGYRHGIQIAGGNNYLVSGNLFFRTHESAGFDIVFKSSSLLESTQLSQNLFNNFSARVGSSESKRESEITQSSRKDEQGIVELLNETLCMKRPVKLNELSSVGVEKTIEAFGAYFGSENDLQAITISLDEYEIRDWCDVN